MDEDIKKDEVAKDNVPSTDNDEKKDVAVVSEAEAAIKPNTAVDDENIEISTVAELDTKKPSSAKVDSYAQIEADKIRNRKKASKKIKKTIRIVVILAIVIFAFWILMQYLAYKGTKELSKYTSGTAYDEVSRMDLAKTISTTGTIQSKDVRTITSALAGVTIEEVNYEVGDMVEEGAVLVTFSREDIDKKISNLQEDISEAKATAALDSGNRDNNYVYNYGTEAYNMSNAATKTTQAAEDLAKANQNLSEARQDKSDYIAKYNTAIMYVNEAEEELKNIEKIYKVWQGVNGAPNPNPDMTVYPDGNMFSDEALLYYSYLTTEEAWQEYIDELTKRAKEYRGIVDGYENKIASYDSSIKAAESSVLSAQRSYDLAITSQNEQARTSVNNISKYDYSYSKENLTSGDSATNLQRQMEDYIDKIDDYIVYAPISGMVTSVNAQEGNGYQATSGALITIQAVDSFEVTTQIDEYDIPDVVVGQRVVIMTDATGDVELEGEVSFISPTATVTNGQNTSSNTYEVRVNILTPNDRIKLGMSAKLNIIIDSHSNVLAVRYDAIEEKANGEKVVYVVDKAPGAADTSKKEDSDSGIVVVGADGSTKGSDNNHNNDMPANQEDKEQTFMQYLFSSKADKEAILNQSLGIVSTPDSAAKEVVVQVGIEGDYYTEILSTEIKEGTAVLVNSNSGRVRNPFEEMMMNGGNYGGDPVNDGPGPGGM